MGDFDTFDHCELGGLNRSFYSSKNGSCLNRTDAFVLRTGICLGPESSRPICLKRLEDPLKTRKQEISNHLMHILVNSKFVDPAYLGALERKLANTLSLLEASAIRHESLCDDDDLDSPLDGRLDRSYGTCLPTLNSVQKSYECLERLAY